jgi:YidC/Oxa1 family membrane protein insertase
MDTRRLILVLIFTFSSFMLWENWQKYNQPKPAAEAVATAPAAGGAPTPSALQARPHRAPAGTVAASNAETFTITTDLLKATISAQGGDLVDLELLNPTPITTTARRLSSCSMPSINTWPSPA